MTVISSYDDVPGCVCAVDVTDGIELSGSTLTEWRDQSGAGVAPVFTPSSTGIVGAVGPAYVASSLIMGGRPSLRWGSGETALQALLSRPAVAPATVFFAGCLTGSVGTSTASVVRVLLDGDTTRFGTSLSRWTVHAMQPLNPAEDIVDATTVVFSPTTNTVLTLGLRSGNIAWAPMKEPFVCWASIKPSGKAEYGCRGMKLSSPTVGTAASINRCGTFRLGRFRVNAVGGGVGNWVGELSAFACYEGNLAPWQKIGLSEMIGERCGVSWTGLYGLGLNLRGVA